MSLSGLTQKRRDHIESCRDNKDKSHEIIADLYSDPSHFIYEVLQNADDAGASEVRFELMLDSLAVTHNGDKLFDYEDVASITTVGSSTKKDDVNLIGKFGAGFKSVFAITDTPCIHSGGFHFQITDFIVPEEIESIDISGHATKIILPFNKSNISVAGTYTKISNFLQTLESESLLFLHNIKKIQWSTEADSGYYLSKITGNNANVVSSINEEEELAKYFLCNKNINIGNTKLNIAVAYRLNDDGDVISVKDSKVFVFFPTNERTGFKFLVHAPYKTKPSRESIPFDDSQNEHITEELSDLIAESIVLLKKSDLLNVDALSILPIDSDNEHELYSPAFDKVKSIFVNDSLLPTESNNYTNAENAILAGVKDLTNLLDDKDCSRLFDKESWLSTKITSDNTRLLRDYLVDELGIPEITMEKFCSGIDEEFIKAKDDKWVIEFYSRIINNTALYRPGNRYQRKGVLRESPIIRLEDGSHINPENDTEDIQVYLPTNGESKYKTVKRALAENGESRRFLENLGLKEPNGVAEIKELIIPRYQGDCIKLDEYTKDFERVLAIWQSSDEYEQSEIVDLLGESHFVRSVNQNGDPIYQIPCKVYSPTEDLLAWFDGNLANDIYFLDLSIKLFVKNREFIEILGVKYDQRMPGIEDVIIHRRSHHKISVNGFNPDFYIHGLKHSLNNITVKRSVLLWEILLKHTNKLRGYIETTTNQSLPYNKGKEQISEAMKLLNNHSWLYGGTGNLLDGSTEQIALDDLSDEYQKEDEHIEKLCKVLGLKLDATIELEKMIRELEESTGKKVISNERYLLLEEYEQRIEDEKQKEEDIWEPDVHPDDAIPLQDNDWKNREPEDLSGQGIAEDSPTSGTDENDYEEQNNNLASSRNNKAIGNWGEGVANGYLKDKYPANDVVWLNKNGQVGKGYDFVIKDNDEDIAYYEVKSKTDESPQSFQVSGAQWNWAQDLHNSKKGDMYTILLISNAGKENSKIKEINDPVNLWGLGKIHAEPVNIKL